MNASQAPCRTNNPVTRFKTATVISRPCSEIHSKWAFRVRLAQSANPTPIIACHSVNCFERASIARSAVAAEASGLGTDSGRRPSAISSRTRRRFGEVTTTLSKPSFSTRSADAAVSATTLAVRVPSPNNAISPATPPRSSRATTAAPRSTRNCPSMTK